ncbi:magnesium-transporting ATPase [Pseudomonas aeruginosa]|nr:magnesium-transporting ATPase [Pseudomonas aeruginosa]
MLAIHLLLQNLMYDISQLSLPWDKIGQGVPRQGRASGNSKNIGRFMVLDRPDLVDLRHHPPTR